MSESHDASASTPPPSAVTIGEETRFTGRAVFAIVSALMFCGGAGLAVYQKLDGIETRLAVVETKVTYLAAQHAEREQPPPNFSTASNP